MYFVLLNYDKMKCEFGVLGLLKEKLNLKSLYLFSPSFVGDFYLTVAFFVIISLFSLFY